MCLAQVAEAALADEHVCGGDRLGLQRRALRLGKPPRRWKQPPWAAHVPPEPRQVIVSSRHLQSFPNLRRLNEMCWQHCSS